MKFLVSNYSCLQNPWLGGYRPQIPVLSVLFPQLNLLNPPPPNKIPGYATASGWPGTKDLCTPKLHITQIQTKGENYYYNDNLFNIYYKQVWMMGSHKHTQIYLHLTIIVISLLTRIKVPTSILGPTQPPNQWVPGALYLGLNWPGYGGDHSPPTSVKGEKT